MRALVSGAVPERVFGATELPRLFETDSVTSIEGIPKQTLIGIQKSYGDTAAFEAIVARSRENMLSLKVSSQVPINCAGQPLFAYLDRIEVDSREYFRDSQVTQKTTASFDGLNQQLGNVIDHPSEYALRGQRHLQLISYRAIPDSSLHGSTALGARTPGIGTAAAFGVGIGLTAYDVHETRQRANELLAQGNERGANSEYQQAIARNVGGWAGGAGTAIALGGSGALPFAAGVASAAVLSAGFEKAVDLKENRDIFNQKDSDGVKWKYNGSYWERPAQFESADSPVKKGVAASYEKQLELNARANAVAAELALAKPTKLLDPFDIPANPEDKKGLDNQNWSRDPVSGGWHRQVREMSPYGERSIYTTEAASPERARELDAEVAQRVMYNIVKGREAIAMAYMEQHAAQRAGEFVAVPEAVRRSLPEAGTVTASNGQLYWLDANGAWSDGRNPASGNVALELELTHRARQPYLEQFDRQMSDLQSKPIPSFAEIESEDLRYRYRIAGTELKPEWQQAIKLATAQTRASAGIEGPTTQQLLPNKTNTIAADSPIAHFQQGSDGITRQVAVTTTEDIEHALVQVRQAATQALAEVKVSAPRNSTMGQSFSPTEKPPGPDSESHPDYALLQQIRSGVRQADEKVGRAYDEGSERLSRSLLAACKDNRDAYPQCDSYSLTANVITKADHVIVGKDNMFVVQGSPGDPASLRTHVNIGVAMNTPLEASDNKLESANLLIGQERERALLQENERTRGQEAVARGF